MIRSIRLITPVVCAVLALAACAKEVEAPFVRGVCFHAVPLKNGQFRFNQVSDHQPNIEHCAASLEAMRLRFAGLGAGGEQMIGAYQGNFIFLQPEGIFIAQKLHGARYLALVRTEDGMLAMPGAVPVEQGR
jgi:hypothetical protein